MIIKRNLIFTLFVILFLSACSGEMETKSEVAAVVETVEEEIKALKFEDLLRDTLELSSGIEVIMSYVEVPKATTLPYHYHPGEEFAYLLEGSGELILKDKSRSTIKAGEAGKVPLKQVHSFSTTDEGAKMVVFRVHEKGQPDRVLVEQ